ncbi:hypothetical protein C8K30_11597 [Promicromonospora sp. AC04]|uniref:hypothetical protein n=1 Tax=Promicromonospora sp. AC04 TaxID=2135723 RepID=UPI000D3562D3|nr:hypothetical protein [Promicromonospora sp. AC04]PUB20886.1 hypothetical protein C8K30_11597 [Promicromonospora sp. AC04]
MSAEQKFEKFRPIPTPALRVLLDSNRVIGGKLGIYDPRGMDALEDVAVISDILRERGVDPDLR